MRVFKFLAVLFVFGFLACQSNPPVFHGLDIQSHQLFVKLSPDNHQVDCVDQIEAESKNANQKILLLVNRNAEIIDLKINGETVNYQKNENFDLSAYISNPDSNTLRDYRHAAELKIDVKPEWKKMNMVIKYRFIATDSVEKAAFSREYIAYQVRGYLGEKGLFLSPSYFWYPQLPDDMARFTIKVVVPERFDVVTQGEMLENVIEKGWRSVVWKADYPVDGLYLVGSHYQVQKKKYKNIAVLTYFFPGTQDLAESYLNACVRYLALYEKLIGPYPFKKFAVVENFFPTGYGMPSYTLLGSQIIRLPFIIYTSLGHEIAHNWWGNSVYVDYDSGNWCEGLTTYTADYLYAEQRSPEAAMRYRRDIDRDFTVYVKEELDFPLSQFRERTETASRAIGYGKSAMVFHQLRRIIGDSLFWEGLRKFYHDNVFRAASWKDIQVAFQQVTGRDLGWYFKQWVERPGAPQLKLEGVSLSDSEVVFTLRQTNPVYKLYVPVVLQFADTSLHQYLWLEKETRRFRIPVSSRPQILAVDPEFNVFRKLDHNEIPPTLAEIFAQEKRLIVLPDRVAAAKAALYRQFAEMLSQATPDTVSVKAVGQLNEEEVRDYSLYLLGTPAENSLWKKLQPELPPELRMEEKNIVLNDETLPGTNQLVVFTLRDTKNKERNFCLIALADDANIGRVGSLLVHYGKYSYLVFENGRNKKKGVYSTPKSPLQYRFE